MQTVERALDILEILADSDGSFVKLGEIAERAHLSKSTASHILSTLCKRGYAYRISRSSGYRLGSELYYLTRNGAYGHRLAEICAPYIRWLYTQTGQTPILTVIAEQKKTIIDYIEGEFVLTGKRQSLIRDNAYSSASGRLLLAGMERSQVLDFIAKNGLPQSYEWPQVHSAEEMFRQLEQLRQQGYSFAECQQKQKERVSVGYACPLYYKTNMVGSLALAVLLEPGEDTAADKRILRKLQWCAERINGLLDFDDVIGVWISRW